MAAERRAGRSCSGKGSGGDAIGPLVLRHASKRSSGTWGPDDYDMIYEGEIVDPAPCQQKDGSQGEPPSRMKNRTLKGGIL
jgi:hypothetical protein